MTSNGVDLNMYTLSHMPTYETYTKFSTLHTAYGTNYISYKTLTTLLTFTVVRTT